ncbi:MAG: hypothetical protein J2O48_04205 [Solirubrobacterales bacterium]|nr:hypothetical protein [Solirubrobacterales bacterium]
MRRPRRITVIAATCAVAAAATTTANAGGSLPVSHASNTRAQAFPNADSCHASGKGLYVLPDRRCTPGALNPAVTQATIHRTICVSGWTSTVRPPESVTEQEKRKAIRAYGNYRGSRLTPYELDHQIPLELGGATNDARNLWPEPNYSGAGHGYYLNPKDHVEDRLKTLVCDGKLRLATAQRLIADNWVAAYPKYH